MGCKYTYKGKTYEAWEFVDVLAEMPRDELAKYIPESARAQFEAIRAAESSNPMMAKIDDEVGMFASVFDATLEEAKRQYAEVVSRHKETKQWMKAPNGEPTKLNQHQWVQTRTPMFMRWFGNWNFDKSAQVNVIEANRIGVDVTDIQAIRDWLLTSEDFNNPVKNKSNGISIEFTSRGLKDSLKRRGDAQRNAYGVLRSLIETAQYVDSVESDRDHLSCQDIYYAALRLDGKLFSVKIKADVRRKDASSAYKDHRVDEIVTDIEITPAVNKGGNDVALGYPADTGPTQSGVTVSLGDIVGDSKPVASKIVDENGEPLVVYHGSDSGGIQNSDKQYSYFDASKDVANEYSFGYDPKGKQSVVQSAYLRIENPLVIDANNAIWSEVTFEGKLEKTDAIVRIAKKRGHDGVVFKNIRDSIADTDLPASDVYVTLGLTGQIKSATGNRGTFDGTNPDIRASITFDLNAFRDKLESHLPAKAANAIRDVFTTHKTFNWYHRTLGTQGYKASLSKEYKRVVEATTMYEQDIARIASEAADLAPDLVPKMDSLRSAMEQAKQALNGKDFTAVSPFVFYGTLAEIDLTSPLNIHYLSNPDALIQKYGKLLPEDQKMAALTPHQIELFKQYRAATDKSLDSLATSEMTRLARVSKLKLAEAEMDLKETANFYFDQVAGEMDTLAERIKELRVEQKAEKKILDQAANDEASNSEKRKTYAKLLMEMSARHKEELDKLKSKMQEFVTLKNGFIDKARKIQELKQKGYAPLMRFGRFTVDVTLKNDAGEVIKDVDGNEMRAFFGMFETESEANAVAREMAQEYPEHTIEQGVLSEHQHELFRSINPETAEAYAKMMGMESDEAFQKYLKMATSNRDAMRRLINRKGTAGFSFDMTRNLASFITSNARASSANLHMGELIQSVADIPKGMGDVKDEAIELLNFVRNPQEKGLAVRSMMFFQFLGGSIASAAVNMTQTFTTTLPYLSQDKFGGPASAAKHIASAMATSASLMRGKTTGDAELDAALKRAENEGIVAPQEIHMLNGEASRGASMATNNIVWRMMENKYPALRYSTRLIDAASSMWGGFFSLAEKYNRQVSFVAAYKMAKEQGKSADEAFKIAEDAVLETQFNYNKSNRSNFGRGTVGATVLTFKTFLINYLEFIKKLPAREQAIALGVLFLLAGAQGLPGADDLDDIIDTIVQAFGGRGNTKEFKREVLASVFGDDSFGKAASDFMLHGVSAFLPLDISGRLSVGNIIPATGMLKKSDKSFQDDVLEVVGPVGSYIGKGADFAKAVVGGANVGDAYMRTIAPKAISDVYQAVDMLQSGAYRDYKGRKVVDVDGTDALIKAIGFQPNSVAEVRRAERMIQQDVSLFRNQKSDATEMWARGIFERDAEKIAKAKDEIAEWNANHPDWKIVIKPANVQRRVQEMNKLSGERMIKAAPKEIRGNVSSVLKSESLQ